MVNEKAKLKKSRVAKEIARKLNYMRDRNNIVVLHSRQIHRLIEYGLGSCSSDRYIRKMRELGLISYIDPRKNNYLYEIKLNDKFFEYFDVKK